MIGTTEIRDKNGIGGSGSWINKKYWGKGYATEMAQALKEYAFGQLGLTRIIALINPENVASAKVAQRIGMKLEKSIVRGESALRDMYVAEKAQ